MNIVIFDIGLGMFPSVIHISFSFIVFFHSQTLIQITAYVVPFHGTYYPQVHWLYNCHCIERQVKNLYLPSQLTSFSSLGCAEVLSRITTACIIDVTVCSLMLKMTDQNQTYQNKRVSTHSNV